MQFGGITLFLVAAMSASFGFILGGLMSAKKVDDLHVRLGTTEKALHAQFALISDLASVLGALLVEIDGGGRIDTNGRSLASAKAILARIQP